MRFHPGPKIRTAGLRAILPEARNLHGKLVHAGLLLIMASLWLGCDDPSTIGRFRTVPVTNIILDSLGVVDEDPEVFAGAREPDPMDLAPSFKEYVIGPGDVLDVSIFELYSSNTPFSERVQVSDTGRITLPIIGTFLAVGRTELELTDDIMDRLSPEILKDPKVNVVVTGSVERVFSISGAVPQPGRYPLGEADFRISEALAQAGGIPQSNADYAYVIRSMASADMINRAANQEAQATGPEVSGMAIRPLNPPSPPVTPPIAPSLPENSLPMAPSPVTPTSPVTLLAPQMTSPAPQATPVDPQREKNDLLESVAPMVLMVSIEEPSAERPSETRPDSSLMEAAAPAEAPVANAAPVDAPAGQMKAVREDGRFRLVPTEGSGSLVPPLPPIAPVVPLPPVTSGDTRPAGKPRLEDMGSGGQSQEVVRVNLRRLRGGDLNQNIVIRAGDDIQVPFNAMGVFHVIGQVSRPGPYSLSGDRLTLKQALATAGPMTSLAWASRCDVTRRIGENKEVTYRVNLEKLFDGSAPDVFLKPNDIINIGSHPVARFVAVIRQSFRSTYGFGFVYDRNLADKDMGN